jgi:hypothetical protein
MMIFIFGSLFLGQDKLPLEMSEGSECSKINCVWYAYKLDAEYKNDFTKN